MRFEGGRVEAIQCDVSQQSQVKEMIEQIVSKFGRLDIAVNNAGVEGKAGKRLHELEEKDIDETTGVNFKGTFLCMKYEISGTRKKHVNLTRKNF